MIEDPKDIHQQLSTKDGRERFERDILIMLIRDLNSHLSSVATRNVNSRGRVGWRERTAYGHSMRDVCERNEWVIQALEFQMEPTELEVLYNRLAMNLKPRFRQINYLSLKLALPQAYKVVQALIECDREGDAQVVVRIIQYLKRLIGE